jgi:hypothetical protein
MMYRLWKSTRWKTNRYVTLENLDGNLDLNRAWESITEHIKTSAKENLGYNVLKHNKP